MASLGMVLKNFVSPKQHHKVVYVEWLHSQSGLQIIPHLITRAFGYGTNNRLWDMLGKLAYIFRVAALLTPDRLRKHRHGLVSDIVWANSAWQVPPP